MALVGTITYNHFGFDPKLQQPRVAKSLGENEKEAMHSIVELTKSLTTLAGSLLALIGFFLLRHIKRESVLSPLNRFSLLLAGSLAILSIDYGYLVFEKWVQLLNQGLFTPFEPLVAIPQNMQLFCLLMSLLLALLVVATIVSEGKEDGDG